MTELIVLATLVLMSHSPFPFSRDQLLDLRALRLIWPKECIRRFTVAPFYCRRRGAQLLPTAAARVQFAWSPLDAVFQRPEIDSAASKVVRLASFIPNVRSKERLSLGSGSSSSAPRQEPDSFEPEARKE